MSKVSSPAALPLFISQLLSKHKELAAELATIEATLGRVTAALGGAATAVAKVVAPKPAPVAKKAKKPVAKKAPVPAAKTPVFAAKAPVKKAAKTGLTAHEFVLAFVKASKNPTTQEINKHWKASGRLGNADNTMSQLTKLKKLKRTPLTGGVRGSSYAAL